MREMLLQLIRLVSILSWMQLNDNEFEMGASHTKNSPIVYLVDVGIQMKIIKSGVSRASNRMEIRVTS